MPSTDSSSPTNASSMARVQGSAARHLHPARSTCPRTSTLRISHFPDPHNRRYNRREQPEDHRAHRRLTTEGSR